MTNEALPQSKDKADVGSTVDSLVNPIRERAAILILTVCCLNSTGPAIDLIRFVSETRRVTWLRVKPDAKMRIAGERAAIPASPKIDPKLMPDR